jgi:hypothetical protein
MGIFSLCCFLFESTVDLSDSAKLSFALNLYFDFDTIF